MAVASQVLVGQPAVVVPPLPSGAAAAKVRAAPLAQAAAAVAALQTDQAAEAARPAQIPLCTRKFKGEGAAQEGAHVR